MLAGFLTVPVSPIATCSSLTEVYNSEMIIITESCISCLTTNAVASNHIIQTKRESCPELRDPIEFPISSSLSTSLWVGIGQVIRPDFLNYLKPYPFFKGYTFMTDIATEMFINVLTTTG